MEPAGSNKAAAHRERSRARLGLLLSTGLHAVVIAGLLVWFQHGPATRIVAAGPGEGGEGGGGSIEVGVADPSAILGFARPKAISYIGDQDNPVNNAKIENERRQADNAEEVLTPSEKDKPERDSIKTDRPVVNQQERAFTGKEERGRSASSAVQVGRSFGSPTPALVGGIGIGTGEGYGAGTGMPGGSEYGRRIQSILSHNYNPPALDAGATQYVVIVLRISRDGRILSISNGRVAATYFKQRSALAQVNYAAERAVLASDPLPPFPAGFLTGVREAAAEIWFRYPK